MNILLKGDIMKGYDEIDDDIEELVSKIIEDVENITNRKMYIEYDNDFIHINLGGKYK